MGKWRVLLVIGCNYVPLHHLLFALRISVFLLIGSVGSPCSCADVCPGGIHGYSDNSNGFVYCAKSNARWFFYCWFQARIRAILRRCRKNKDANVMGGTARAVSVVLESEGIKFEVIAMYLSVMWLYSESLINHIGSAATICDAASINESLTTG